jgi:CBS domain-containing protein
MVLPIVNSRRPICVARFEEMVSAYAEKPVTIPPSTPLKDIVSTMVKENADHLYVVNERGELIGVIAKIDVARRPIPHTKRAGSST